ncbi:hypothetical protein MBLNU230_g0827t1 [Neophaeotheca triangularis]
MPFSPVVVGAFASLLVGASASSGLVARELPLPHLVPIEKRQDVSPEQYQCHSNCGNAILDADGDHCDSSDWNELYSGCMECAEEFGIWQWYQSGVTEAAEECGLDAEPVEADGDDDEDESPAAPEPEPTVEETPVPEETTAVEVPVPEETTVVEEAPAAETNTVSEDIPAAEETPDVEETPAAPTATVAPVPEQPEEDAAPVATATETGIWVGNDTAPVPTSTATSPALPEESDDPMEFDGGASAMGASWVAAIGVLMAPFLV